MIACMSVRTSAAAALLLVAAVGCGPDVPPGPSLESALAWACPVLPIARDVRTNLSLTRDAARGGDPSTAARAARAAAEGSARIQTALQALNPRPSRDAVLSYLVSINISAQQVAVLFTAGPPRPPQNLASLERVLALLDQSFAAMQPDIDRSGLANC
jgi:hypothetical protein